MGFECQLICLVSFFSPLLLLFLQGAVAQQHYLNVSSSSSSRMLKGRKQVSGSCNLFQGKWVVDDSYPFYDSASCPFIDSEFDCLRYGRPDRQYLKYAWLPDSCNLPRFNGVDFLERWRGKKIMFVGDSLSLNMWESLSCMLHASVPNAKTTFLKRDSMASVTFEKNLIHIKNYLMWVVSRAKWWVPQAVIL